MNSGFSFLVYRLLHLLRMIGWGWIIGGGRCISRWCRWWLINRNRFRVHCHWLGINRFYRFCLVDMLGFIDRKRLIVIY